MKQKIIGIVVCMLMIATVFSVAASSTKNENKLTETSMDVDWWPMIGHDAANTRSSSSLAPATNATFLKKQIVSDIKFQDMINIPGDLFPIVDNGQLSFQIRRDDNPDGGVDLPDNINNINALAGTSIWKKPVAASGSVTYSVAQDDDKLIVSRMNEGLQCRNINDGALLWTFPVQVWSPPVIDNHNIYFLSYDKLHCLNMGGVEIWNVSFENTFYTSANPAVTDGKVFTAIGLGSYQVLVSCFNATTGASIWNYTIDNYLYTASPAVADGKVFVVASDQNMEQIYCLDATGNGDGTTNVLWSIVFNPPGDGYAKALAVSSGYVYGNAVSLIDGSFMIFCLDATTGAEIWEYPLWSEGLTPSTPAVADGKVYVSGRNTVYCVDALGNGDGTTDLLWSYSVQNAEPSREHFLAPIIGPGKVWAGYIYYIGLENNPFPNPDYQVYGFSMYGFGSPNSPPATPDTPTGPSEGIVGQKMTFTTKTIDPDGDPVWYQWQLGSATTGWIGPFDSNQVVQQDLIPTIAGPSQVKVRAKDYYTPSSYSQSKPVVIYQTGLEIGNITSNPLKLGVAATISNIGDETATNVSWTISVKGGILGLINRTVSGSKSSLAAGDSLDIKLFLIIGFGKISINVTAKADNANEETQSAEGSVFIFLVNVK